MKMIDEIRTKLWSKYVNNHLIFDIYSSNEVVRPLSEEAGEVKITSRQGKKAPLPHEHEPHTIVGITVGAFLLIFIGTG